MGELEDAIRERAARRAAEDASPWRRLNAPRFVVADGVGPNAAKVFDDFVRRLGPGEGVGALRFPAAADPLNLQSSDRDFFLAWPPRRGRDCGRWSFREVVARIEPLAIEHSRLLFFGGSSSLTGYALVHTHETGWVAANTLGDRYRCWPWQDDDLKGMAYKWMIEYAEGSAEALRRSREGNGNLVGDVLG